MGVVLLYFVNNPRMLCFQILTASLHSFPASSFVFRVSFSTSVIRVPAQKSAFKHCFVICFDYGNTINYLIRTVHVFSVTRVYKRTEGTSKE